MSDKDEIIKNNNEELKKMKTKTDKMVEIIKNLKNSSKESGGK